MKNLQIEFHFTNFIFLSSIQAIEKVRQKIEKIDKNWLLSFKFAFSTLHQPPLFPPEKNSQKYEKYPTAEQNQPKEIRTKTTKKLRIFRSNCILQRPPSVVPIIRVHKQGRQAKKGYQFNNIISLYQSICSAF